MNVVMIIFYSIAAAYLVGIGIFALIKKYKVRKTLKEKEKQNDEK